jgi:MFS family permease
MRLKTALQRSNTLFIAWAVIASFGAYFCMYAFRKPFNAGLYEGLEIGEMSYKAVLIISQVAGYTLSKFAGIKVISELKHSSRIKLILTLILIAEVALLFFGIVPYPYNFIFLFINGLPLGMVYGVVFSFLEGRRFTEMLAMGLNISVVVASGILKTTYIEIHFRLPWISEFWMPAFMGALFLPLFCVFVWMLSIIPEPTQEDIQLRTERVPMTKEDKRLVMAQFGFPIVCLVIFYATLVVLRDFRDNFTIEIWNEIDANWASSVFTTTEMITAIVVLVIIGGLAFVRDNLKGFRLTNLILFVSVLLLGGGTFLFENGAINGFNWMLMVGLGTFLAYTILQTVVFERMIALFRMRANAGYFVYICESIGYLGSVTLLLYKEFFMKDLSWSKVLMQFTYLQFFLGLALLACSNIYLEKIRVSREQKADESRLAAA